MSRYDIERKNVIKTLRDMAQSGEAFASFLKTAARNYKYNVVEQASIYAYNPAAIACASFREWNTLGVWLQRGAKGIPLLDKTRDDVRFVFDISDTHARADISKYVWELDDKDAPRVLELITSHYNDLSSTTVLQALIDATTQTVNDRIVDNLPHLREDMVSTELEHLDDDTLANTLQAYVTPTAVYMAMYRCGYDVDNYYPPSSLQGITALRTTRAVFAIMSEANKAAREVIGEVEAAVRKISRERIISNEQRAEENNTGRVDENRIRAGGELLSAERNDLESSADTRTGILRDGEAEISGRAERSSLLGNVSGGNTNRTPEEHRPASERDGSESHEQGQDTQGSDRKPQTGDASSVGETSSRNQEGSTASSLARGGISLDNASRQHYIVHPEDTVDIDGTLYIVLSVSADVVRLSDEAYPLFTREIETELFFDKLENSVANDKYLRRAEERALSAANTAESAPALHDSLEIAKIIYSEHPAFADSLPVQSILDSSNFAVLNEFISILDDNAKNQLGYYKTDFELEGILGGEEFGYEGRYDIGDGDGTIIEHIRDYNTYMASENSPFPEARENAAAILSSLVYIDAFAVLTPADERCIDELMSYQICWDYNHPLSDAPMFLEAKNSIKKLNPAANFSDLTNVLLFSDGQYEIVADMDKLSVCAFFDNKKVETLTTSLGYTEFTDYLRSMETSNRVYDENEAILSISPDYFAHAEAWAKTYDAIGVLRKNAEAESVIFFGANAEIVAAVSGEIPSFVQPRYFAEPISTIIMRDADAAMRMLLDSGVSTAIISIDGDKNDIVTAYTTADYIPIGMEIEGSDGLPFAVIVNADYDNNTVVFKRLSDKAEYELTVHEARNIVVGDYKLDDVSAFAPTQPTATPTATHLQPSIPNSARHQYRLTNDDIGVGNTHERFTANIDAIRTLKQIESENRLASPEEQEVLAKYVGWGGLSDYFDVDNTDYSLLKNLLTDDEYNAAMESTLTAFYTPPAIARAMYAVLNTLPLQRGRMLEPSCGVGNFLGAMPSNVDGIEITGIELDSISGRIAQQLYQKSDIVVGGFESAKMPSNYFDIAIGNIPFGDLRISDTAYGKKSHLIHDYFFIKALDKVRVGGIVAFITSSGTLDRKSTSVKEYIARRATLLGAIRLPDTTFKSAAGTTVTSDIIILQKRATPVAVIEDSEHDWVYSTAATSYFKSHPQYALGVLNYTRGRYGDYVLECKQDNRLDFDSALNRALAAISSRIDTSLLDAEITDTEASSDAIPADPAHRHFSYVVHDNKVYYQETDTMTLVRLNSAAQTRMINLIDLRDTLLAVMDEQRNTHLADGISELQTKLNEKYDAFVDTFGRISSKTNDDLFRGDDSFPLLLALEIYDTQTGDFLSKADIFTKRTIRPPEPIKECDNSVDALALSIGNKGFVDIDYMTALTRFSAEKIEADLSGAIYRDISFSAQEAIEFLQNSAESELPTVIDSYLSTRPFILADEFLSGNVRERLAVVAALYDNNKQNDTLKSYVEALRVVQPEPLVAADIGVRLGSTWIPTSDIRDFIFELLEPPYYLQREINVSYNNVTGDWRVSGKNIDSSLNATQVYGTSRISAYALIEASLNLREVKIYDYSYDAEGKSTRKLNTKETMLAQNKQAAIRDEFKSWIWKDVTRRTRLVAYYNTHYNCIVPRKYNGEHILFSGMNPDIRLRPHQRDAIARILYGGNTLLAHPVGAGKTYEIVAATQELKRLGLCTKSLIAVPNHLTRQWGAEYMRLYPSAHVLIADKDDFTAANRKRFCSRIALGDYDAIIIGHSQFDKIQMSPEYEANFLETQIAEISESIALMSSNRDAQITIKQLARQKRSLTKKLEKIYARQDNADTTVYFEQLGVDRLFIDEAHNYKNLEMVTKLTNIGNINASGSNRAAALYAKTRYLDEITNGRGVVFATATFVTNSMAEVYTMQRYLQASLLSSLHLNAFDAWVAQFGEIVTALELAPEGTGYRFKTRLANFSNLPELIAYFRQTADILTPEQLNLDLPEVERETVLIPASPQQKEYVESLADRASQVHAGNVDSRVDNMLAITNDGRKLALDQRLVDADYPAADYDKVTACAERVYAFWHEHQEDKLTQAVFCDLSTPKDTFNVYSALRDKLCDMGMPRAEIAFIHDYKTDKSKETLFGKINRGEIRVILGSTDKLGTGTNMQRLLGVLHNLDCPWRPSDLEQRAGRIIRQGNLNDNVKIISYVTDSTFDSYLYQTVETKQRFISQVFSSGAIPRTAEDVDSAALSYAEIKALCAGNPAVKERMELEVEVQKLALVRANYLRNKHELENDLLNYLPVQIKKQEERIKLITDDINYLHNDGNIDFDGEKKPVPLRIGETTYTTRLDAGKALLAALAQLKENSHATIGEFNGFEVVAERGSATASHYTVSLVRSHRYTAELGYDAVGNMIRLENLLHNTIPSYLEESTRELNLLNQRVADAKVIVNTPFEQENEYKDKCARLNELTALLRVGDSEIATLDDESIDESIDVEDETSNAFMFQIKPNEIEFAL